MTHELEVPKGKEEANRRSRARNLYKTGHRPKAGLQPRTKAGIIM
jgi:hypothetical protein